MLAVVLALASSLAYGISDFLGGLTSRSAALLSVLVVSQGTALVLLSVIVISRAEHPPDGAFLLYAAFAGLSEAVGVAALYRGLAVGVMSVVAPIGATAPVVPVVVGIVLGEIPTPIQGGGIVLAVTGIALTSLGRPSGEMAAGGRLASSTFFGLLSALGFGGFFAFMDAASEGDVPWALLVARLTAVTAFVAAMLLRRAPLAVRGAQLPAIVSIGALIVGADSMYAISSTVGLLGVVAVLSSLYPVVTVALARIYLHERVERLQQIGIAACLSGVAAISGATGDGIAEMHSHEAKQQQITDVRIEKQLAAEDQKTLIQRAPGGLVINIASTAGLGFGPYVSPEYAAAKAGLIRFTSSLAGRRRERTNENSPTWRHPFGRRLPPHLGRRDRGRGGRVRQQRSPRRPGDMARRARLLGVLGR